MRARVSDCCKLRATPSPWSQATTVALWKVCYFGLMVNYYAALIVFVLIGAVLGWFNPIP